MKKSNINFLDLTEIKDWVGVQATDTSQDNKLIRLMNLACQKAESYIEGPILNRIIAETRDGNSSDTIVPDHWPVREVLEIKIDYNRAFSDATTVLPENYVLRGPFSTGTEKLGTSPYVQVRGQDIVLRDDNNTAILGRIFAGSVVQSIEIKYKAGWGETPEDLPADLVQAAFMIVEFFYTLNKSNRLGVKSKSSNGQSISWGSDAGGLPPEITGILDNYKDYTFGHVDKPQKNTFTI